MEIAVVEQSKRFMNVSFQMGQPPEHNHPDGRWLQVKETSYCCYAISKGDFSMVIR
jgi:hypothetical protein